MANSNLIHEYVLISDQISLYLHKRKNQLVKFQSELKEVRVTVKHIVSQSQKLLKK